MPAGGVHDELAGEAGADVLDLADDPLAVLAEQVELRDLRAVVGDVEAELAGRRLGGRDVAGVVGRAHRDRAVVARAADGVAFCVQAARAGAATARASSGRRRMGTTGPWGSGAGGSAGGQCAAGVGAGVGAAGAAADAERRRTPRRKSSIDRHGVGDPDDRLEHRGDRGEVEDALEQRGVPGAGVDHAGDVERDGR